MSFIPRPCMAAAHACSYWGAIALTQRVCRSMGPRGRGHVVMMGSVASSVVTPLWGFCECCRMYDGAWMHGCMDASESACTCLVCNGDGM